MNRISERYFDMSLSLGYYIEREHVGAKPYTITARTRHRKKFKIHRYYYFLDVIDGRIQEPFKLTKHYKKHTLETDFRAYKILMCNPFGRACPHNKRS